MPAINAIKEAGLSQQPIHLWLFTWGDGATLAVCTHSLTHNSVDYLPRVMQERIDPIQALSPQGIEIPPAVRLTLADADKDLYAIEVERKFRGARLQCTFGFYDFVAQAWSSDTIVPFLGRCEEPEVTDDSLIVTARHILNLEAKKLPSFPIQPRCPKLFPYTAAMKALAAVKRSPYFACGVTDPSKISCTFDKAGCLANDVPLRFGGTTFEVPPASRSREYTSGNWIEDLVTDTNEAKYGDKAPLVYGTAWVDCLGLGAWPEANSTRGEAIVCEGRPEAILKVVVNDEELPAANSIDGASYIVADPLFRYNVISTGDRDGALNGDAPWNGAGDPHGSLCKILWVVYRRVTAGQPRVRALIRGPKVQTYAKIATVVNGVVTLADNAVNYDIAGNPPFSVTLFGNSNGALNATWELTNWTTGPPGTVTLTGTSDSGTGGYIAYEASSDQYAWVIVDVLLRAGLSTNDIDFDSFINAANRHRKLVDFTARDGSAQQHAKYTCSLVLPRQRTAADILTGLLRGCSSHLGRDLATGKIALFARGSLAEQQPAPVDGSNDNVATAGGYLAYHFSEASMVRDQSKMTRAGRGSGAIANSITAPFANEENDYSGDSVQVVDADDIALMAQEIPGSIAVDGCTALDRANRVGNVFLAEQIEGEIWRWVTTHRAVKLRVGHIIGVTNGPHGFERALMRVQSIAPAQNWETCAIEASEHDDAWYADDYQPVTGNASTGPRRDRLARPSFPWAPYQVQPAVGDPLFARTEWTFGLRLTYETLRNGSPQPYAMVTGKKPVNEPQNLRPPVLAAQGTTADSGGAVPGGGAVYYIAVAGRLNGKPGPMSNVCQVAVAQSGEDNTITAAVNFWDPAGSGHFVFVGRSAHRLTAVNDAGFNGSPGSVTVTAIPGATWGAPDTEFDRAIVVPKICWHAGVFGAALTGVATRALTIAGAGWSVNQWADYDCMVLAKTDLSELGILCYRVLSNTGDTLTIRGDSPDPDAAGVVAGDVLVMLSKASVSGMTLTDLHWENSLSNGGLGLNPGEEVGRIGYVLAGKGRGYRYAVEANDETSITFRGPWVVAPDSTSRMIILDAGSLPDKADSTPISNDDPQAEMTLSVPLRNYAGKTVLLEAVTMDGGGNASAANVNPVRLVWVPGQPGVLGGQYSIQVGGFLAVDDPAAPAVVVETDRTVRDVFGLLGTAADAEVQVRIDVDGAEYCTITFDAAETESDVIDELPALVEGQVITIAVLSVGSVPGADLTVVIRL